MDGDRSKGSTEGGVLHAGHAMRELPLAPPTPTGRNTAEYLPGPDGVTSAHRTFILTNNPTRWEFDPDELVDWVDATAAGHPVEGRWSTGATTKKISPGDRAFLLRQGVPNRGMFASGRFISDVYQAEHWNGRGGLANYADVLWDTVLDPDDALPIEVLFAELPEGHWKPQASGSEARPAVVDGLEKIWADHLASLLRAVRPASTPGTTLGVGRERRLDAKLRGEIENLAQQRLMDVYDADGWQVEDFHVGNPFDAKATKNGEVLYLEAKGTITDGVGVIVTIGEVAWAQDHPGKCIMGIVSNITLKGDGSVDPASGTLRQYIWDPRDEDLFQLDYNYYPPVDAEFDEI